MFGIFSKISILSARGLAWRDGFVAGVYNSVKLAAAPVLVLGIYTPIDMCLLLE